MLLSLSVLPSLLHHKQDQFHHSGSTSSSATLYQKIRHHFDPVLVADNITRGCSTSTLTTSQCFNNIANHNSDNYNGLIALGSVLLVIFMIVWTSLLHNIVGLLHLHLCMQIKILEYNNDGGFSLSYVIDRYTLFH